MEEVNGTSFLVGGEEGEERGSFR